MIVDTSAMVAIITGEPEREVFLRAIETADAVALYAQRARHGPRALCNSTRPTAHQRDQ